MTACRSFIDDDPRSIEEARAQLAAAEALPESDPVRPELILHAQDWIRTYAAISARDLASSAGGA